jgi:hypothetical protein
MNNTIAISSDAICGPTTPGHSNASTPSPSSGRKFKISRPPKIDTNLGNEESMDRLISLSTHPTLSPKSPKKLSLFHQPSDVEESDYWEGIPKDYSHLFPVNKTEHGKQVDAEAQEMGTYHKFAKEELAERKLEVVDGKLCSMRNAPLKKKESPKEAALAHEAALMQASMASLSLEEQPSPESPTFRNLREMFHPDSP